MQRWAEELHGPDRNRLGGPGHSPLAALMDGKGLVIRRPRGPVPLGSVSADIELIVNRHLPSRLERLAWIHYVWMDLEVPCWERYGCSRAQYYRRLNLLHVAVAERLLRRRAA